ncbi:hypothetical protein [Sphingobium sp. AP50]|uniref:hypothetical protein n=1 Tax=Sphingobium sp. AP50 TaxID=1884369 RepID=UPI001160CD03|nr:hypothetical protein [Sphingobium sp. AP50]
MSGFSLVLAVVLIGASMASVAEPHEALHIMCAQSRTFDVRISANQARVQLADGQLLLTRKPSSLGDHFRNDDATLIIDEDFVAFAQRGDWDWQDCHVDPSFGPKR